MKTRINKFVVENAFIKFASNIAKYDVRDDDICDYVSHLNTHKQSSNLHLFIVIVMRTQREYFVFMNYDTLMQRANVIQIAQS